MERRSFLCGSAVMTIMVANGQVWRAFGQDSPEFGEGPAFEPWKTWPEDAKQGPIALVHAAILSSNAFNTQPWLFKVSQSRIELYADLRRNLGAFDPYRHRGRRQSLPHLKWPTRQVPKYPSATHTKTQR
jgi:hypothetical protein